MTESSHEAPREVRVKTHQSPPVSGHVYLRRPVANEGLGKDCYPAEDAPVELTEEAPDDEIHYGSSRNDEGIRALFKQIKDLLKTRRARLRALRKESAKLRKELTAKFVKQSLTDQRVRYSHVEGYILLPADILGVESRQIDWSMISQFYLKPIREWLRLYANAWLRCGRWDLTIYVRDLEHLYHERALFRRGHLTSVGSATRPLDLMVAAYMRRWVAATPTSLANLLQKCRGPNGEPAEQWWNDQRDFGVILRRDNRVRKLTAKETLKYQRQTRRYSKYRAALEAAEVYRTQSEKIIDSTGRSVDSCYEKLHELIDFHQMHHIRRWPIDTTQISTVTNIGRSLARVTSDDRFLKRGLIAGHTGVAGLAMMSRYRDSENTHTYALSTRTEAGDKDITPPLTWDIPISSHEDATDLISVAAGSRATPIQRIDLTPDWWQDSMDRTIASAALKLQNLRVTPRDDLFNLGRSIAELKDTPLLWKQAEEMLALGKLSAAEFLTKVRGKKVHAAYYEHLLRSARITHLSHAPVRVSAALYLAYKFGVEPSLADIDTLVGATRQWVRAVRRGLVGMYRVCQEAVKAATMRAYVADATVMANGRVDLSTGNPGSVDLTVSLPIVSSGYEEADGYWHPGRPEWSELYCPDKLEVDLNGDWAECPNFAKCLMADGGFTQEEREGWVTALFNDFVAKQLPSLGQLRYRWYLARNSKVFARINASEINKILRLEEQRNFLASGLQFKVAWELVPLSFLVDWFTNTAKIATAITDAWQSWSDEVYFTDDGLWAVIRSDLYGSLETPTSLMIRSARLIHGCTIPVRYVGPDGRRVDVLNQYSMLGTDRDDFYAYRNGIVTGEQMKYDGRYHSPNGAFNWAYHSRTENSHFYFYRCGTVHAVVTAQYAKESRMDPQLVARSTTRLPIEVQAWRALLPRLEFHMSAGKLTSLLALIVQGARWAR